MLDYTAIDFETANSYRGSPCAVGLVKVRDGQIVDQQRWLIRPPERSDWFASFNVSLHGITAESVADAPRWAQILPSLIDYIGGDVVVAHNAGFDIGVIRYACAVDEIPWPEMNFLCSLVLARRAFRLPSYRLPFVTQACGLELTDHHDPLADARAVVNIINHMATTEGVTDVFALARRHHIVVGHMLGDEYKGSTRIGVGGSTSLTAASQNPDADPDGYLYGRHVVFTGALMSMTRQLAWNEVVRAGGIPEKNTTKRTNVVVLGDFNPASLCPGAVLSKKAQRAFDLQDKGQDIELMTEDDFNQILEGHDLRDFPPELLK